MKSCLLRISSAFLIVHSVACGAREPVEIPTAPDAAVEAVRNSYKRETWRPDSSHIAKVEYFPESQRGFLIVTFKRRGWGNSKPYIYEGIPTAMWEDWKAAESAGKWYHRKLRGNTLYFFRG